MCKVTRRSEYTGVEHTREIKVDPVALRNYELGAGLIQDVLPGLSTEDQTFLISGVTPDELQQYNVSKSWIVVRTLNEAGDKYIRPTAAKRNPSYSIR